MVVRKIGANEWVIEGKHVRITVKKLEIKSYYPSPKTITDYYIEKIELYGMVTVDYLISLLREFKLYIKGD